MANNAVAQNRVSRIVGYQLTTGNFATVSPNLPQRIAVLAEANDVNQGTLSLTPTQITSAQQAGNLYGYGSPVYLNARILFPQTGSGGVSGIPVYVYPQAKAVGATAKKIEITPSGVAIANGTHTLVIAGRGGMDGFFYNININAGDTVPTIAAKIATAVNNILGSPMTAVSTPYVADMTSKWSGLTADGLSITVDTSQAPNIGITYNIASIQAGSGTPDVQPALNLFGADWNTIVINSYGTNTQTMTTLEAFNGIPDPLNPTGRFVGIIALTGSVADDPSAVTDARLINLTIAICPAPASAGLPMEAAANMAVLFALVCQNTPHLDVAGKQYPDMPTPLVIGSMADYNNRDAMVQKGCSTVSLNAGSYKIQDFVTTYHPIGENPPQFRYCRNIMLDMNIRFMYHILEDINVRDHAIANDTDVVTASNVIKPKQWVAILQGFALDLAKASLIVDAPFMQKSLTVGLSVTNPDRLETFFKYKRSGFVRIASTTAQAGFNFGQTN
jgi:phage tail sheath gpL-like